MGDRGEKLEQYLAEGQRLSKGQKDEVRRLAEFVPTAIGNSQFGIASSPDLGKEQRPIFFNQIMAGEGMAELGWFWNYGLGEEPVKFRELTTQERESMIFAHQVLGLPSLVTVHLVMNKGMTKEEMEIKFGRSKAGGEVSLLLSLGKYSMQGKSILAVELKRRGETVVDLDKFSDESMEDYRASLGEDAGKMSTQEVVEKILQMTGKKEDGKREEWTAEKALDKLTAVFEGGNRPEVVICDMPGYRMPVEGEEARRRNIFDAIAERSMTMVVLMRMGKEGIETESEMEWRVIDDYVKQYYQMKEGYCRIARTKENMFDDFVSSDMESLGWDFESWALETELLSRGILQLVKP